MNLREKKPHLQERKGRKKLGRRKFSSMEEEKKVVRSQENLSADSSSSINSTNVDNEIWDFEKPTCICQHCNTLLWYEEILGPIN
jgi:hypothetical protein